MTNIVDLYDVASWRRFFAVTKFSIGVETARPWIDAGGEVAGYIQNLVESLISILGDLGARVTPRLTAPGEDFKVRHLREDAFLFSHHSIGSGDFISRFKHSYLPNHFAFDPSGYAGFSKFAQETDLLAPAWALPADRAISYAEALRYSMIQRNTSKYAQPPITELGPPSGYVFLPLQMPRDTVIRLSRSSPLMFYRRVVEEARKQGLRCVVKRHPRCRDPEMTVFLSEIEKLEGVILSTLSINSLIPAADRVVVINSTVGLEALIHGRPTLTFAPSEYAPLTTQIAELDDIPHILKNEPFFDEIKTAQFLEFFFEDYCVASNDRERILLKVLKILSVLPPRYGWTLRQ